MTSHEMVGHWCPPEQVPPITHTPLPRLTPDTDVRTNENGRRCAMMMRVVRECVCVCARCEVHFITPESFNLTLRVILVLPREAEPCWSYFRWDEI